MSFLKKLFGGGGGEATPAAPAKPVKTLEYQGFTISATPYQEGGQWQTCGVVAKDIGGVRKEHRFIRADRFSDQAAAADHALLKGQQIIDQVGEGVFK